MDDFSLLETTPEVWAVLRARHHKDMEVYGSFSAPEGDMHGDPTTARMMTIYSIKGSPFLKAETTWEAGSLARKNEQHRYWLCIPREVS
jgi:hypothetical protein